MKTAKWLAAGLLAASVPAWAAGPDGLWEVTTRMEVDGVPAGLAAPGLPGGVQKQTVCVAEGKAYEPEPQKECRVLEQKRAGRKSFTRVQCPEGTMTIDSEQLSRDHWRSKMVLSGEAAGTIHSEGRRVGACDAATEGGVSRETQQAVAGVEAQGAAIAAELGRACRQAIWPGDHPFEQYDLLARQRQDALAQAKGRNLKMIDAIHPEVPACAQAKAEYCAQAKAAGRELATRPGYAAVFGRHGEAAAKALRYCGVETAGVLAGHCRAAAAESDFGFVAAHCPAERRTLAAQHCGGRAYTAVEPRLRPLCGGDADGRAEPATAAGASAGGQVVEEGVRQLKKLFGF